VLYWSVFVVEGAARDDPLDAVVAKRNKEEPEMFRKTAQQTLTSSTSGPPEWKNFAIYFVSSLDLQAIVWHYSTHCRRNDDVTYVSHLGYIANA